MVKHIRPYRVFEKLGFDNEAHLVIPSVPGTESLTVFSLETLLLIAVARIVKARSILEIGTSQGYTALHLAMNTKATITTVDIEQKRCIFEGTPYSSRISRVIGTAEAVKVLGFDMVFIDADHSYDAVRADTEVALSRNPKVIAWHDYGNPAEPGNTQFLDQLDGIYHVEDSWICLRFQDGREL